MIFAPGKSPLLFGVGLAALVMFPGASALATVTLQFSSATSVASNWANGAGEANKNMAWGIIVDRDGDGLVSNYAVTGVNYGVRASVAGQSLLDASGTVTDDLLFMAHISMVSLPATADGRDGATTGQNLVTVLGPALYLPGMDAGDAFYLVWFDTDFGSSAAPVYGTPQVGDAYGVFGSPDLLIPPDGYTVSFADVFSGVDPLKPMTNTWSSGTAAAPEPSSMLLGLLAALGLLRRRR